MLHSSEAEKSVIDLVDELSSLIRLDNDGATVPADHIEKKLLQRRSLSQSLGVARARTMEAETISSTSRQAH